VRRKPGRCHEIGEVRLVGGMSGEYAGQSLLDLVNLAAFLPCYAPGDKYGAVAVISPLLIG